ncbi:MAG: ATP-dependent 6-phosphofructokinase [candidate division WOR-3 bacterium]|nr:ATP-dependent 6-phosphofructokinase [candidate division WOR-3 bacterium]
MKKIGVITGGGDSPGTNAAIRAIVKRANLDGIDILGFKDGWAGLIKNDWQVLGLKEVSGVLPSGGTLLGSSRTNPFKTEEGVSKVRETYKKNGLDALIAIGGDDTLGVAHKLKDYGIKAVGIPQTIDNDLAETEFAIGFDSALARVTEAIDGLHTTAYSHHRVMVVEVMGRDSGWIGLFGGLAGGADIILVPEEPYTVKEIKKRIEERRAKGKNFSIVVISEGAKPVELDQQITKGTETDEFGHVRLSGIGHYLADQLREILDMDVRVTRLAYLQRGGQATPFDRLLATRFGVLAVELCINGDFDEMTALKASKVVPVELEKMLSKSPKPIDKKLLDLRKIFY